MRVISVKVECSKCGKIGDSEHIDIEGAGCQCGPNDLTCMCVYPHLEIQCPNCKYLGSTSL